MSVRLTVDGAEMEVHRDGVSLLEALRDELGVRSPKDGCSPQGQCGCCTVLVDGAPRVACVTSVRRVAGRAVTTADGLDPAVAGPLVDAFVAAGASQCGFCTPGILCRLAGLGPDADRSRVETALLAHLCRCTGWRSIVDAALDAHLPAGPETAGTGRRDTAQAAARAAIEGGGPQLVGRDAALGRGGFADDLAPADALVAVPDGLGGWAVGESLAEARAAAGKVQGRRSGRPPTWPVELPEGDWAVTLRTTWVEPGYLEPDASWCRPGGVPASPLGNGGAFGGKVGSPVPAAARTLADRHGRAVRVLYTREDAVRLGPKRPPVAGGVRPDGTGVLRVAATPGLADAIASVAPGLVVEEVPVAGPPTSVALRAAGWAEASVLLAAAAAVREGRVAAPPTGAAGGQSGRARVAGPTGGAAEAEVEVDGAGLPVAVRAEVSCGAPLDLAVVRSYATGAVHMALGWVLAEAVAVDDAGVPEDLTVRSWGILRARDTPRIRVDVVDADGPPVNGSDAVFAAVAAATWIALGLPPAWPARRGLFG